MNRDFIKNKDLIKMVPSKGIVVSLILLGGIKAGMDYVIV